MLCERAPVAVLKRTGLLAARAEQAGWVQDWDRRLRRPDDATPARPADDAARPAWKMEPGAARPAAAALNRHREMIQVNYGATVALQRPSTGHIQDAHGSLGYTTDLPRWEGDCNRQRSAPARNL